MNTRYLLFALCSLLTALTAHAQYELKVSNFNAIYTPYNGSGGAATPAGPPTGSNQGTLPATLNSNYLGAGQITGSSGIKDATPNDATAPGTIPTAHGDRFPANTAKTIVLTRSTIGGIFASGLPRYFLGDVVSPPLVQADGITTAPANYWRIKPVLPGEIVTPFVTGGSVTVTSSSTSTANVTVTTPVPGALVVGSALLGRTVATLNTGTGAITLSGGNANQTISTATSVSYGSLPSTLTPLPGGVVTVTSSSVTSTQVIVSTTPSELVVGNTLLGQPITAVTGSTVTLAGTANQTITSSTPNVPITPTTSFYYSPHAEKVFANQPGRVTVLWVTTNPTANGGYETFLDVFSVSSNTSAPVRTIFWTEGSFDGPRVQITDGRITTVNPAFYSTVPKAVAQEVSIPGYNPPVPNLTTLSFDRYNGIGQIHAYNVEGRIFVEYLGNPRLAGNIYESVGYDVVDIVRVPTVTTATVNLGKEITPHTGNSALIASPVLSSSQTGAGYYATNVTSDGSSAYFAERETSSANAPDDGSPSSEDAYNKVVFYWLETGSFGINWPKFQDRYWQRWSPNLADYAHYTTGPTGSTPATGIPFTGGTLPSIVYQDDTNQAEAQIDNTTQRLFVSFTGGRTRNRSLLKFSGADTWYVNLYTQAENRSSTLSSTSSTSGGVTTVTVSSTAGLEVGMIVTGPGITGSVTISSIVNSTQFTLSQTIANATNNLTYTVESDAVAPINTTATVGTRIDPPAGHEIAGYISGGTGYYPAGYLNPFVVGVEAANNGAIIPVNAEPTDNVLTVRWFKKFALNKPDSFTQDLYVPGKIGRYTVSYPSSTTPQIVLAQGVGTDDLTGAEATGSIYVQNNPAQPGYNPNEEHALMRAPRAYALRDDLNITSGGGYTSLPFVLISYTALDGRPAIHAYKVVRTGTVNSVFYDFDYTTTAGTLLVKPYPLPLMGKPLVNGVLKEVENTGSNVPINTHTTITSNTAYTGFTFTTRSGLTWVHRGPHNGGTPSFTMQLYYPTEAGFFIPGMGEVAVGTVVPFLRAAGSNGTLLNLNDTPLTISYSPVWPTDVPELRVGETLTLPKFGLPQVRGQKSAQVLYQQSLANDNTNALTKTSAVLVDPTREKTYAFDPNGTGLKAIPTSVKTTSYQGRTYFQGMPPHLQQRFYFDPLRGAGGTLVFIGTFHDEAAGEDYLDLNALTAAEETLIKDLIPSGDGNEANWDAAIDALNTRVETFKVDPAQAGSYIVDTTKNADVGENELTFVSSPDTAVDSYALTGTGKGSGYVTLVFGNGKAFTPDGDPVAVQIIKVSPQLYVGDLKVISSSNPLDEKVTLRHSADFAAKPEDYEFDWRWATGAASSPATYSTVMTKRIGDPLTSSQNWIVVRNPRTSTASNAQYAAAGAAVPFPRSENVHPTSYTDAEIARGEPVIIMKHNNGVDFTTGVPGRIVFSADIGTHDGVALYVNGVYVLSYNAPAVRFSTNTNSSTGLTTNGLSLQFDVASSYFSAAVNKVEVAIFSEADLDSQSTLNFMLEAAQETDLVSSGSTWFTPTDPTGKNTNTAIVGGDPANPFGGSTFILNDRWFTMRYRPKINTGNILATGGTQSAVAWSRWMPPQFVEGWVKRVLAAINPFEQRVKDLYNNSVNTDVSVVQQAGKRWEGDIALTMDNINDAGLIEIYETVLNRAKNMSIDANTNDPDSNNALTLAAGYLNDLYTILGNEAYADAANSTISLDDQTTVTEVNTSRFSFEGQVASSLDEELALLRGRDDSVSPGARTTPAYNRLYWNYTHGINSGEVLYAINYNIKEKVGSSTANGVIDEFDAQRMFPQGHGDAYGHYLTALTGYYRLLTNANFTWTPRGEAVTILGQPVTVDFQDERKLAAASGNIARTAQQIAALVYRQSYKDDPASGWNHYSDTTPPNSSTGITSEQGLDEWVSRSEQGAYFNWVVGNALVPDVDPYNSGVQKIDRTTVPELAELAAASETFQTTIDNANAHLNPLGLSPGAIAFDISPTELQAGKSHFEQVYGRALSSLVNAAGSFNQAAKMTRSLRNQDNLLSDYNTVIEQQEQAYLNQLIDIYGRPYSGDVGAGKLFAQGYAGPDLVHWFIVDRPTNVVDTAKTFTISITEAINLGYNAASPLNSIVNGFASTGTTVKSVAIAPSQFVQYSDVWQAGGIGTRPEVGELQRALNDTQLAWLAIYDANIRYQKQSAQVAHLARVFDSLVATHTAQNNLLTTQQPKILNAHRLAVALNVEATAIDDVANALWMGGDVLAEYFPKDVGFSNDLTSTGRGVAKTFGLIGWVAEKVVATVARSLSAAQDVRELEETQSLEKQMQAIGFTQEEVQLAYEYDNLLRDSRTHAAELMQLLITLQRSNENVRNVIAKGNRILADREVFRQRAAAVIQGYRTKDLTFRLFRNEALEQYRSLYDLASRYTYLAAKSYDYETGLLGSTQGQTVFSDIVAARSLGDVTAGTPLSTVSSLGDSGLAGVMAKLNADFSVAKGRLGINNPDQYGTVFSLRTELYRLLNDDTITSDDDAWRQTLEQHIVADVMADADVATYCLNIKKASGTAAPGIIIPFTTTIQQAKNFFGLDLASGDHSYSPSSFATKIYNVGIALPGYVGMDTYATGNVNGAPTSNSPNGLSATPYVYLIPCGSDYLRAPALGDTNTIRIWNVHDQALPLPYNLGATNFNTTQFFNANGTLSEQPWILRKHQAFRAVENATFFYSSVPQEFTNSRLIGRSVWNGQWKIVIPAYTLLSNEQTGLDRFTATVKDIQLFLRTYSHSGN